MLDQDARSEDFKPYPLDGLTKHAPPGTKMEGGTYPVVTGLEHDEWGHPSGNPEMHAKMNARRRDKIKLFGDSLAVPGIHGDDSGEVLIVGWGSTWGPIRESINRMREKGRKVGTMHLRHLNPLPNGLEDVFSQYDHVVVVEINDEGLYGMGQLATLLRARYCDPRIVSVCKTDGLTYKVREIIERVDALVS